MPHAFSPSPSFAALRGTGRPGPAWPAAAMLALAMAFAALAFFSPAAPMAAAAETPLTVELSPAVVLSGTENVRVFARGCPPPVKVTSENGEAVPCAVRPGRGPRAAHALLFPRVPAAAQRLRLHFADPALPPVFLPVAREFRVVFTFDDGPAQGPTAQAAASPTWQVLDALDAFRHGENGERQGTSAVFFLLTSPDTFLGDTFTKGETPFGAATIRETARRGHVLGVHWGGGYGAQTITHPGHAALPPRGLENGHAGQESLLESELQQCIDRVTALTGQRPEFVRPTLWVYRDKRHPEISALPAYRRLGLKMTLTDAKYPDGGYKIISMFFPGKRRLFARNLRAAFLSGETNLVFSMHDSNSQTAAALPGLLAMVQTVFDGLDFGAGAPNREGGKRLRFAATPDEARAILRAKKRFVMFPPVE